jgi:hypothetical protein
LTHLTTTPHFKRSIIDSHQTEPDPTLVHLNKMAKKGAAGGGGETSKKAQGQARKAEAAAGKQAAKNQQAEKAEAEEWNKGAKSNAKA